MLDTHAAVKELTKAGLSEDAAEAIVQVQLRTLHQGLATKEDILGLKLEIEKRFGEIEQRFTENERRFSSLEARMSRLTFLVWVVLAIVALTNPIAARLLERLLGVPL
jgi:DNA gyrase/topoisomerase IV subunit A